MPVGIWNPLSEHLCGGLVLEHIRIDTEGPCDYYASEPSPFVRTLREKDVGPAIMCRPDELWRLDHLVRDLSW